MIKLMKISTIILSVLCVTVCFAKEPVADMHIHYKWSQREVTSVQTALGILQHEEIEFAVVIGTPPELALELQRAMPKRIIALFSPYQDNADWFRWASDDSVVQQAEDALNSGLYHGIGELHLIGGFAPDSSKSEVVNDLLQLAEKHDVPVMLHTEYSNADVIFSLCRKHARTRIIWAHAGAILEPAVVEEVLRECSNVWAGLAARDPWRFVNNPITSDDGKLLPEWRNLLLKYSDRFMVGSDPVWPVEQMNRWDEPDTGWQEMERFWEYHRQWLKQLPDQIRHRIALANARNLFTGNRDIRGANR